MADEVRRCSIQSGTVKLVSAKRQTLEDFYARWRLGGLPEDDDDQAKRSENLDAKGESLVFGSLAETGNVM